MLLDLRASLWLAAGLASSAVAYFVARLVTVRRRYGKLPGPPHSFLWGHLPMIGAYTQKMPPGGYIQSVVTQLKQDHALPDIFYLDLWPFGPPMMMLTSPDAAAIPTTLNGYGMPGLVTRFFEENVGGTFIEAANGQLWKDLLQQIAPALTPTASKAFHHSIVDDAKELHDRFAQLAESDQPVDMTFELGRFPFHVLGTVFFGERLSKQAYDYSTRMVKLMQIKGIPGSLVNPLKKLRWRKDMDTCLGGLDNEIEALIHARYAALQEQKSESAKMKATTILDRMLLARLKNGTSLDSTQMQILLENGKGFIAAGFGTTTDTSTYVWALLSAFPEVLEKVRAEHDRVLDKDFDRTIEMLHETPALLNSLEYTTAVVQETLRLFPVGMGVREAPPNVTSIDYKGTKYPLEKKQMLAVVGHTLHYSADVFEDPKLFQPERFLNPDKPVPRNGYRPFERGVRACLGQTLAMDEMKTSLVLLARWFDFELVDHKPVAESESIFGHTDLDTKLGIHAYQVHAFTAMPAGSVKMRVRKAVVRT
ncbi:hypothetical protein S40285_07806 [Stachybotrys chlorohalonatus IBT 40285]|uniref:Uncharacterized protein n=1 Tax=Stachybotrys chlorohalonatus (strain IBT 40285) TaxID=1283841 RepID=A0A084R2F4_STAC4|nr:hypothetical protein S40285_07806 [Stachybotrys chlorohalonata IBT 40285]